MNRPLGELITVAMLVGKSGSGESTDARKTSTPQRKLITAFHYGDHEDKIVPYSPYEDSPFWFLLWLPLVSSLFEDSEHLSMNSVWTWSHFHLLLLYLWVRVRVNIDLKIVPGLETSLIATPLQSNILRKLPSAHHTAVHYVLWGVGTQLDRSGWHQMAKMCCRYKNQCTSLLQHCAFEPKKRINFYRVQTTFIFLKMKGCF